MKTNVSIKFSSIEEYREIEKKLIELGYKDDREWNNFALKEYELLNFVIIYHTSKFEVHSHNGNLKHYNSLEEFLKDE